MTKEELIQKYENLKEYDYDERESIIRKVIKNKIKTEEETTEYLNKIETEENIESFSSKLQNYNSKKILSMFENINLYYKEIREVLVGKVRELNLKSEVEIKEKLKNQDEDRAIFLEKIKTIDYKELREIDNESYYYFKEAIDAIYDEMEKREEEIENKKTKKEEAVEEPEEIIINGVPVSKKVIERKSRIIRMIIFTILAAIYYGVVIYQDCIEEVTEDFFEGKNLSMLFIFMISSDILGMLFYKTTKKIKFYFKLKVVLYIILLIFAKESFRIDYYYLNEKLNLSSYELFRKIHPLPIETVATTESAVTIEELKKSETEDAELLEKYKTKDMKEIEDKIKKLTKQIENNPKNAELYYERGECYRKLFKKESALENYNKAIELDKNQSKYYYARIKSYPVTNKLMMEEIGKDLDKAIELSKLSIGLEVQAKLYRDNRMFDSAIESYERLININENDQKAYEGIIYTYLDTGICDKPAEYADLYIKKFPTSPNGYILSAKTHMEWNNTNEIIEICNKGIEKFSDSAELYCIRGKGKNMKNDYQGAIADFEKAIEIGLDNEITEEAYLNKGVVYTEIKDLEKAIEAYNKAIEINLKDENEYTKELAAKAYEKLAGIYNLKGDSIKSQEYQKIKNELIDYKAVLIGEYD